MCDLCEKNLATIKLPTMYVCESCRALVQVTKFERVMDRGGHLSTADWHLYEGARAAIQALVPVFDCEARGPVEEQTPLRYRGDFDRELRKIVAEFQAGRG